MGWYALGGICFELLVPHGDSPCRRLRTEAQRQARAVFAAVASAAADRMHNLNPVTGLQAGIGVLTAHHDVMVQLDGNAPVMQLQLLQ